MNYCYFRFVLDEERGGVGKAIKKRMNAEMMFIDRVDSLLEIFSCKHFKQ